MRATAGTRLRAHTTPGDVHVRPRPGGHRHVDRSRRHARPRLRRCSTQFEVERFLYEEAALLDRKRVRRSGSTCSPTTPTTSCRSAARARSASSTGVHAAEARWPTSTTTRWCSTAASRSSIGHGLGGGSAVADPPHHHERAVVEDRGEELDVESNFILYRTRLKSEEYTWIGSRQDTLRRDGDVVEDREAHDPARADRAAHAQPEQLLLTGRAGRVWEDADITDAALLRRIYDIALVTRAVDERLWILTRQGRAGLRADGSGARDRVDRERRGAARGAGQRVA